VAADNLRQVFDAENGNKGPNAGHVHCMLSYSRDNASTWQWVDPQGLAGLKEFIPAGPLGSFESHVCFAAHSPLRMPDGSTRLYYMGGNVSASHPAPSSEFRVRLSLLSHHIDCVSASILRSAKYSFAVGSAFRST
jgi:hypothetical protein